MNNSTPTARHGLVKNPKPATKAATSTAALSTVDQRPPIEIRGFTPLRRGQSLYGFAQITVRSIHLHLDEIAVHRLGQKAWVSLPAKPLLDRVTGEALRDETGKPRWAAPLRWTSHAAADRFSAAVISALLGEFPHALDDTFGDGDQP